jgi:hypothetical protein
MVLMSLSWVSAPSAAVDRQHQYQATTRAQQPAQRDRLPHRVLERMVGDHDVGGPVGQIDWQRDDAEPGAATPLRASAFGSMRTFSQACSSSRR